MIIIMIIIIIMIMIMIIVILAYLRCQAQACRESEVVRRLVRCKPGSSFDHWKEYEKDNNKDYNGDNNKDDNEDDNLHDNKDNNKDENEDDNDWEEYDNKAEDEVACENEDHHHQHQILTWIDQKFCWAVWSWKGVKFILTVCFSVLSDYTWSKLIRIG